MPTATLAAVRSRENETSKLLDRLSEILLANDFRGYFIRLITEPLPIFILWSLGDVLGFLTGWRDFRFGQVIKGIIKMTTAIIPFFPTIATHIVIDKMFGSK